MEFIKLYENKQLIILDINKQQWFKGNDLASILGYCNKEKAIRMHVDEDDKKKLEDFEPAQIGGVKNLANNGQTIFVNESGLYSLILRSKLPSAKQFKRWVTSEVLPSIRKTGEYKINKDEQDIKKIEKIEKGYKLLNQFGMVTDRDKMFLGTQVKNMLMEDKIIPQNHVIEYPLTRRLLDHRINYTNKMKNNLIKAGQRLRQLYFTKYGKYPEKRNQYVDNALRSVNIYTNEDFDIMDEALSHFFQF